MAYVLTSDEYVEVDGVPLATPAWTHENLEQLWAGPSVRGQDRVLPGAAGVRPYMRRATVTRRDLSLVIVGDLSWEGVRYADWRAGLQLNVDHLRTQVADPTYTGDGTRTATLHMADGSTRTAKVHAEGFELSPLNWFAVRAVLTLSLLSGAFA